MCNVVNCGRFSPNGRDSQRGSGTQNWNSLKIVLQLITSFSTLKKCLTTYNFLRELSSNLNHCPTLVQNLLLCVSKIVLIDVLYCYIFFIEITQDHSAKLISVGQVHTSSPRQPSCLMYRRALFKSHSNGKGRVRKSKNLDGSYSRDKKLIIFYDAIFHVTPISLPDCGHVGVVINRFLFNHT